MDVKPVNEEGTLAANVIALHLDISASNPTSVIITGNSANAEEKVRHMSNNCILKKPFISSLGGRTRSASAGRDKKSDLRARYWASLFENLQHAIYNLYQTCETDENVSECEEVILVLENYTREFRDLAKWFRMKCEYENTPPSQRPTSLAWGVSKSSPGKIFYKNSPSKPDRVCRELIVELDSETKTNLDTCGVLPLQMKVNLDNGNAIDEQATNTNSITNDNFIQSIDLKTDKPGRIDSSCQTDDDPLAIKRTLTPSRKLILNAPHPKKLTRNLSVSTLSEKSASASSTLPAKRVSTCISPRKPVPGRNIAAPEFVPGRKLATLGKLTESKSTFETTNPAKISRSNSDTIFETNNSLPKNQNNKKPNASVECVKNVGKDEFGPKSPGLNPMQVIIEHKITGVTDAGDAIKETKIESVQKIQAEEKLPEITINLDATPKETETPPNEELSTSSSNSEVITGNSPAAIDSTCNQSVKSETVTSTINSTSPTDTSNAVAQLEIKESDVTPATCIKKSEDDSIIEKKLICDPVQKNEIRKTFVKNDSANRTRTRQYDFKTASSANREVYRKGNQAPAPIISRNVNQNYVKNVGVPKTFNDIKSERRSCSELKGQNGFRPIATANDSKVAKMNNNHSPSYIISIKGSPKETRNGLQQNISEINNRSNMFRSKTSIEMKSKARETQKCSVPVKTCSEERDLPPRSRRSSKDTDGWETVISRSRRSFPNSLNVKDKFKVLDPSKRFYEPSPSTSLPSLAMENGKEKSLDCAKSENGKNRHRNNSHTNNGNGNNNNHTSNGNANKTNSAEKIDQANGNYNYKLNKERPIISSTAMFTTIPSKRKKPAEKDSKKTKPKENKRKSSKESDKQEKSENLLYEESLRKSRELSAKEKSLQLEINELRKDGIEVDGDSDSTEIDSEIAELYQNKESTAAERRALLEGKYSHLLCEMTWAEQIETLNKLEELMERDPTGKSLKFAKNFTSLKQVEDFMMRWPGRALELHQKLSSPSRKRISPDSTILQHKARQAKAKRNREQLLQDKSAKIKKLFNKVAEKKAVKAMQSILAEERRKMLDEKLKRAEENRNLHLKNIQEKAHDEAKKQKEIAFINELEAQNKRHDFNALCQEQENRFKSILEGRQRRQEEKAEKNAAFEERRKAIEAEFQEKIEELQEKMRKREERIGREFQEKERERMKVAREKARDREDRLLALQAAQIANAEELQKKIQQKQVNSARRHEENIESIRQRAIEIGTPRLTPYQINKLCSVCNVVIDSEVFLLSHLRGLSHQEALKKYREQFEASVKFNECSIITDAPADILLEKKSKEKERQKTLRKRCKKIRQRLSARSEDYLKEMNNKREATQKADTPSKKRMLKSIKEIEKLINTQDGGVWPNNAVTSLERNLFEIIRIIDKGDKKDQLSFADFEGFTMLSKIYNLALDLPKNMSPYLPLKCFVVASNLYTNACNGNVDNCLYVLLSNNIVQILEFLLNRLNLIMPNSDDRNGMVVYKADTVADVLMNLCSIILTNITLHASNEIKKANSESTDVSRHLQEVISYIVCTGIVDKLAVYCSSVHDDKSANSFFLLHAIQFLTSLVETRPASLTVKEDSTSLMATLKATELVGAVSMLYAMLLHQDSMSNDVQSSITILQPDVVNVVIAALQLFSRVCELNLEFFQNILGAEGISLQVRHIISYLLKYCVQNEGSTEDLLHQVIEFIGYFAIHHHENQMILQSGSTPTVLQQLSNLPFAYFSNPKLVRILFPTLLACCVDNPQNKVILDQEMSFQLLEDFKNSDESKDIPLIKLLH